MNSQSSRQDVYKKYLNPTVVSRLSSMELRAKLVVEGFMAGLHKSPYHGFSVEFAEHRQYMPGDDLKHVDWKVYGKTDRYYVKQFEEETNLKAHILLDCSGSMAYGSGEVSKFQYASYLASAIIYLLVKQRDAAGLVTFDENIQRYLPPRSVATYLPVLLSELENTETSKSTDIAATLHEIAERIKRRGLVLVFSDFFDQNIDGVIQGLKHFRHRNHEVLVFQVLDVMESTFAFKDDTIFEDLETQEKMSTQPAQIRAEYRKLMQQFIRRIQKSCRENNIDHVLLTTETPYDLALSQFLQKRKRVGG